MADTNEQNEMATFEKFAKQVFELWVIPERDRRVAEGRWEPGRHHNAIQVLFGDAGVTTVRFESEVKGVLSVDPVTPLTIGEPVNIDDVKIFTGFELLEADREYGHVTMFNQGRPTIFFDFRRNRVTGLQLVNLAEQFSDTAEFALSAGHIGPFIDNMFSAYELTAKADLITWVLGLSDTKRHGYIASTVNIHGRLGNFPPDFVSNFNILSNLRSGARYDPKKLGSLRDGAEVLRVLKREHRAYRQKFEPRLSSVAEASA